jgi:hypothetical protein
LFNQETFPLKTLPAFISRSGLDDPLHDLTQTRRVIFSVCSQFKQEHCPDDKWHSCVEKVILPPSPPSNLCQIPNANSEKQHCANRCSFPRQNQRVNQKQMPGTGESPNPRNRIFHHTNPI